MSENTDETKHYDSSMDGIDPQEGGTSKPEDLTKDYDESIDGIDVEGHGLVSEQKDRFTDHADYKDGVGE